METTLPDDLLHNLALLTQKLNQGGVTTNNVDITGLDDEDYSNRFASTTSGTIGGMKVESNLDLSLDRRLSKKIRPDNIQSETNRILAIDGNHENFKLDVKELSRIEELISEYSTLITDLKKKKNELRQKTLTHMVQHKIDTAKVGKKESFTVVTTKKKVNPTTKVRLPNKIRDYFVSIEKWDTTRAEEMSKSIVKWIHENAEYQTAKVLRHQKARDSKE